jgi:hypothetical protein
MTIQQLNILVQLATIDNEIADKELNMIRILGKANGIAEEEIDDLIKNPRPIGDLKSLTNDEKFEYLYNIVQLMKIDRRVYKSEIVFCEEMAIKLGYKKSVVGEISSKIYSDPSITADREELKQKIQKFLQ